MPRLTGDEPTRPDQFIVRLPKGMRDQIAARAAANGRSMNSEIIAALESHLEGQDRLTEISDFIEDHKNNITALESLRETVRKQGETIEDLRRAVNYFTK